MKVTQRYLYPDGKTGERGMGCLVKVRGSNNWYSVVYHAGRQIVTATGTADDLAKAKKVHRSVLDKIGSDRLGHRVFRPETEKVTMKALFDLVETNYEQKGNRSTDTLDYKLRPLRRAFDARRAYSITGGTIDGYKADRLATEWRGQRLRPTTVNRELSVLRRAFKLGATKLGLDPPARVPTIEMLPESEPRSGFVEPDQFEAVVAALPDYLQDLARYGYLTGWRSGAIRALRWDDITGERVTLRREHSKNRKSYTLPLRGDLAAIIARRRQARTVKQDDGTTTISERVFHREGQPIGDFGKAWTSACLAARLYTVLTASEAATTRGVVKIVDPATTRTIVVKPPIFHDLRRSAARNLRRAGISSDVGRKITGHETTSMWTRYSIVDETDVAAALDKVDAFVSQQAAQAPRKVIAFPQR